MIFLVGPTASGKTAAAVKLAGKLNAEIISCDSMQVYKGMRILSSQPSELELKKARHHLLSLIDPEKEFNVSRYRRLALARVRDIHERGKVPLFVGGSGLYMSVVIDGIFKEKAGNGKVRRELFRLALEKPGAFLHKKLSSVDPRAAAKIHPNDTKRIVRALEVYEVTGRPMSELQATRRGLGDKYDIKIFGLDMDREELDRRIDRRVERMFRQGLVREVNVLLKKKLSKTSRYAIGIREIKGYLDGEYSLKEAKELVKKNTRHYARRQMTWFRKDKRIEWINGTVPMEHLAPQEVKRKRSYRSGRLAGKIILLLAVLSAPPAFAANSYNITSGSTQIIDECGLKKSVKNNCSMKVFVPTKTSGEWNAFVNNHPSCVELSDVPTGACGPAAGVTTSTIPSANLCSVGTASAVSYRQPDYYFRWTCGGTAACMAPQEMPWCATNGNCKAKCLASGGTLVYNPLSSTDYALFCRLQPCITTTSAYLCPSGWGTLSYLACYVPPNVCTIDNYINGPRCALCY